MSLKWWKDAPPPAEQWFANLPFDDPLCVNASCKAYRRYLLDSQITTAWSCQGEYGHYTAYICAGLLILFGVSHTYNAWRKPMGPRKTSASDSDSDSLSKAKSAHTTTCDKLAARVRRVMYRRATGRLSRLGLPSLGVGLLFLLIVGVVAIMSFAQHPYYRPKRVMGSPPIAMRAGLMAFALYPVEISLAGKLSLVTLTTGVGHEKLKVLHRWIGYVIVALALLHVVPYSVQPLRLTDDEPDDGPDPVLHTATPQNYLAREYERTGIAPLVILAAMFLFSLPPLRRACYEVFARSHHVLAAAFVGLSFWHAGFMLDSSYYLYVTAALWLFGLVARMTRKMSLVAPRGNAGRSCAAAMAKLWGGVVRLEVSVKGRWQWEPGQHFYLRFPSIRFLDNHPFSVCNMPETGARNWDGDQPSTQMVFLIRPQKGITGRIGALADTKTSLGLAVEGSYGTVVRPRVQEHCDNVILVAGGGGISFLLPWLEYLPPKMTNGATAVGRLTLVWIIQDPGCLSWIEETVQYMRAHYPGADVRLDIYITRKPASQPPEKSDSADVEKGIPRASAAASTLMESAHLGHRPNLGELIPSMVPSGSATMVLGCGPDSIKTDLSNAVARAQDVVLRGDAKSIRLHTETFGW